MRCFGSNAAGQISMTITGLLCSHHLDKLIVVNL